MRNHRHPERDWIASLETTGLLALAAQEGEGEVESFDLTSAVLFDSTFAAGDEVLLQFVEARQHLRQGRPPPPSSIERRLTPSPGRTSRPPCTLCGHRARPY
jgi:hypothetical protein